MRKFSKLISLICALAMVLTMMPAVNTYAAFSGDEVDFEDYSGGDVSSYLTAKDFMVVNSTFSIDDEGANGKMLHLGRGGRVVRWYDPARNSKANITDDFTYEFEFMQKTKGAVADIGTPSCSPWNSGQYGFQFSSDGTNLTLKHGGGTDTVVENYGAGTVYTVKFLIKLSNHTIRIWIDGEEKLTDKTITFLNNINNVSRIDFNAATAEMYIGRITLEQYIDLAVEVEKLGAKIEQARDTIAALPAGDYLNHYPQSAIDEALSKIAEVEATYDSFVIATPDDIALIDEQSEKLQGALSELLTKIKVGYVTKYAMDFDSKTLQSDSWNQYMGHSETVTMGDDKALYAANLSGGLTRVLRVFPESIKGAAVVSFSFMQPVKAPVYAISEIKSASYSEKDTIYTLSSDGTNILIGSNAVVENYEAEKWYDIKIELNSTARAMLIYVDGERVLSDRTIPYMGENALALDRWETQISAVGSDIYIDDIKIEGNVNTDYEKVATEIESVFANKDCVVDDIDLPLSYNGYTFVWESDNESVISNDGKVTRQESGDEEVILTAYITKGEYTYKTEYTLTVPGIVYNTVIEDDFNSYRDGARPSGWSIPSGTVEVTPADGEKYVKISGKMQKNTPYKNITPAGFIELDFMQSAKSEVSAILSLTQNKEMFRIGTDGNDILAYYEGAEDGKVILSGYEEGKWYNIRAIYNLKDGEFAVIIDGVDVLSDEVIYKGVTTETARLVLNSMGSEMNVDNVSFGTAKVATIEFENAPESVLRPANGQTKVAYKVLFKDANGNRVYPEALEWTVKNESGQDAENITVENNALVIPQDGESGLMTVTANIKGDSSVKATATLEVVAQEVKEIKVSGTTKITRAGEYNYTAEVISEYDVVLPSDGIVWSVEGNATIDENGKLTISSLRGSSVTVKATLGDKEGTLKVKLEAPSAGGGGGGGSFGGGGITASPVEIPEDPTENGEVMSFNDVPVSYWAAEAVYALTKEGIVSGVGNDNFAPEEKVSRSQFAKMLVEAFDIKASGTAVFKDADKNAWYYTYINAANGAGIINGYPDGTFGVDDAITRQDAAVMLARALNYKGIKSEAETVSYNDAEKIAPYAADAIGTMLKAGIMSGRGNNNFDPEANMTRAEAATVFYRMLNLVEGR